MERKFCYNYPRPMVTVDTVVLCIKNDEPSVLLIKRLNEPFKDLWALPGGFVDMDEDLKDAASRELKEETAIQLDEMHQILTAGTPDRDPRGRNISVVYAGFLHEPVNPQNGDDAKEAAWFSLMNLPGLAFDHNKVIMNVFDNLYEPFNLKKLVSENKKLVKTRSVIKRLISGK